jgi:predicted HicB family RNase H-like nuclease
MSSLKLNEKEQAIYEKAKKVLEKGITASEFSERFFSPQGELQSIYQTKKGKEQFVTSELYKWLQEQLAHLRIAGAKEFEHETEQASGRLTIMIPKSLHSALKKEAAREGVSLSELIRLKLGYPYRLLTSLLSDEHKRQSQPHF